MPKVKLLFGNYLRFNEKIKRALISVSDKKFKTFIKYFKKNKVEIISSGGTYKIIRKLKFNCTEISK